MKIVIKATNIKLNRALENFIQKKINDLEKFLEIFHKNYFNSFYGKGKPRVEAWVEIGKTTLHHKKGPFFRVECQMHLPAKSLRSEALSHDLRLAVVEVKDELQRQLKQYKNKLIAETRRRQRQLKKELHLSPRARFYRRGRIREEGM